MLEQGYELGFDEMKLANEDDRNRQAVKWLEQEKGIGTIAVKENDKQIVLQAKDFTYVLDKRTGCLRTCSLPEEVILTIQWN